MSDSSAVTTPHCEFQDTISGCVSARNALTNDDGYVNVHDAMTLSKNGGCGGVQSGPVHEIYSIPCKRLENEKLATFNGENNN